MADESAQRWRSLPPGIDDAEAIGRGGFSTVFRGWQAEFNRQVAVKVVDADADDPAVRARFEREVRAMGTVSDHPNVVPIYDAGIHDARPYLVMPYLPGGSLADELANGPLPADEVVRVGRGVADALAAAHAVGLLHRDVKPANILRSPYGEPMLADFGVARFADATATHGHLAVTLAFAAPEVLSGHPATPASDIYSLGATLHALLRGEPPFAVPEDGAPLAMAVRVLADEPADLRATGVSPALAAVIARAMDKDPARRFPSAAAFRGALAAAAEGASEPVPTMALPDPVPAPPVRTVQRVDDRAPRPVSSGSPRQARILVGGLLLLATALVALLVGVNLVDDDGRSGGGDQADEVAQTPTSEATVGAPAQVEVSPTVPEITVTTDEPSAVGPVDAAREYFALLDAGRVDDGWAMLSPRYQRESGESSYRGFWSTIASVDVLDAEPVGADAAKVRLRYTRTDGTTVTEPNTLRFTSTPDGRLLVDGSS